MLQVVTALNEKGGVGKTSLSVQIAAGLAILGQRVLLLDSDPQANATEQFRMKPFDGLLRLLAQDADWKDVVFAPEQMWHNGDAKGSLYVMPCHENVRALPLMLSNAWELRDRLNELADMNVVDVVVIDTSPTPSLLHSMIYMSTHWFLFPTECESMSIDGLAKSTLHWKQANEERKGRGIPGSQILGIVPTMYRQNTMSHSTNLGSIQKHFGKLAWSPIMLRTVWGQASDVKRTLFSYAPDDIATVEAWNVVKRVQEKMQSA